MSFLNICQKFFGQKSFVLRRDERESKALTQSTQRKRGEPQRVLDDWGKQQFPGFSVFLRVSSVFSVLKPCAIPFAIRPE